MIYDTHCHIDLLNSMNRFCRELNNKKITILSMTTTPKAYALEVERLHQFSTIALSLGLHPQLVATRKNELPMVDKYISSCQFIGEIGLDFSRRHYASKKDQEYVFEHIIDSCTQSKTISIHSVFSTKQVLDVLEKHATPQNNFCILHWFTGTSKQLNRAIELGCYFSINEQMLSSSKGGELVRAIPLNRLLLESDAPFVGNINTVLELRQSLSRVLASISRIKECDVNFQILETSRKVLHL